MPREVSGRQADYSATVDDYEPTKPTGEPADKLATDFAARCSSAVAVKGKNLLKMQIGESSVL